MAWRTLLQLSICFLLYKSSCCAEQSCSQENQCLCRFNDYLKIDLWPLLNDGLYTTASKSAKYFFSICENYNGSAIQCGFNTTNTTTEATCDPPFSLCKCDSSKNVSTKLGVIKDRNFVDVLTDQNTEKLVYVNGNTVVASVLLACSQLKEIYLFPLTNVTDELILFTQYACPIIEESGMSTGTTLLVIVFFLLLFYFVFGALLLHFIRGARGIEMIPNLQFWKDLPYLVRDGAIFLFNGCRPTAIARSDVYDRI